MTVDSVDFLVRGIGDEHHVQAKALSITQSTELGTRYPLDAVREVTGHPVPVVVGERRAGDPAQLVASSDRIRADLAGDFHLGGLG